MVDLIGGFGVNWEEKGEKCKRIKIKDMYRCNSNPKGPSFRLTRRSVARTDYGLMYITRRRICHRLRVSWLRMVPANRTG